jgi:hypothetical protein
MADVRTLLSCDVGWRRYARYMTSDPEAQAIFKQLGYAKAVWTTIRVIPRLLRAVAEAAQRNGDTNATITDGHCRIGLYGFPLDPNQLQLMFWQGDIDAVADVVRRNRIDFYTAPHDDGQGRSFMIRDPDDNPLFFINMEKYKL